MSVMETVLTVVLCVLGLGIVPAWIGYTLVRIRRALPKLISGTKVQRQAIKVQRQAIKVCHDIVEPFMPIVRSVLIIFGVGAPCIIALFFSLDVWEESQKLAHSQTSWKMVVAMGNPPVNLEYFASREGCEAERTFRSREAYTAHQSIPMLECLTTLSWVERLQEGWKRVLEAPKRATGPPPPSPPRVPWGPTFGPPAPAPAPAQTAPQAERYGPPNPYDSMSLDELMKRYLETGKGAK